MTIIFLKLELKKENLMKINMKFPSNCEGDKT